MDDGASKAAGGSTQGQDVADPITIQIIRNELVSIPNQIDRNITRTAFSQLINEYKDYAVGIVDVEGNLESKLKSLVGLQFKTGYLVNPETLVYGTAGVVRGKFELTATNPRGSLTESYSARSYCV